MKHGGNPTAMKDGLTTTSLVNPQQNHEQRFSFMIVNRDIFHYSNPYQLEK